MDGWNFDSADGKPTRLHQVLSEADFDRLKTADDQRTRNKIRITLDEWSAMLFPAHVYGDWLEALGFPDLAERARTELAESTRAGDTATAMLEQGRRART